LGKKLKIRRLNEYFGRLTDIAGGNDPAAENVELKKKLDESNKKLCADLNAVSFLVIEKYCGNKILLPIK